MLTMTTRTLGMTTMVFSRRSFNHSSLSSTPRLKPAICPGQEMCVNQLLLYLAGIWKLTGLKSVKKRRIQRCTVTEISVGEYIDENGRARPQTVCIHMTSPNDTLLT